ncbi:hypothetical protein [Mycoplasmopsis arginini]|uniref:hypothetical protein n=1 Tax=Mycoplasmopsis arginini TaxID=2094 RepID=UPI0015E7E8CC|nr:hypothetical protein [Mycoplasmopsis arginini]
MKIKAKEIEKAQKNYGEFLEKAESDPNTFLYFKPEVKQQPTDEDTPKFRM